MIASEQSLKTERKANMRKIIAAGCLMAAITLCVGCSSAKDGSKYNKKVNKMKKRNQNSTKEPAAKQNRQRLRMHKGKKRSSHESQRVMENAFAHEECLAVKNFVILYRM